jgi:hypothetical protein
VPLHTIRDWLSHTSIAQTSTSLAGPMRAQHDAMAAFEARYAPGNASRAAGGLTIRRQHPESSSREVTAPGSLPSVS